MPTTIGPLFSLAARKSFGKTLTFQKRRSKTIVFIKTTPYDPHSPYQLSHRDIVAQSVVYWQSLTAEQKKLWNDFIKS